ncbi:hypothetical protein BGZ99_007646 [Dissophora globulifera]|uniref:UBX domain-containing protein n=1 Tax=Dissophora globulifera TaxID=979702 RepID=A0A9P6RW74_9FUNG|nr:hypothetical protein BGZ99_007646 [Dissophora globulifera]
MSSDLRARLLELGFNLSQARAAVAAGNETVESATDWIFGNGTTSASSSSNGSGSATALHLRDEQSDKYEADLQQALAESTRAQPVPLAPPVAPSSAKAAAASSPDEASMAKKIKINIVRGDPSNATTPLLPLTSRHNEEELRAQDAARVAEATRRAEKSKRERMEAKQARERTLNALKEDRENRKLRGHAAANVSPNEPISTTPAAPPVVSNKPTMVQLRLKSGSVIKKSFDSGATIKDLFELARLEDGGIGSADISLIQPFPRREFTATDSSLSLQDAGLSPSCSLNVFVQTPIPAPQPINPGGWISEDIEMAEPATGDIEDDLMSDQEDEQPAAEVLYGDDAEENEDDQDDEDDQDENENEDEEEEEDDDEDMMHALPMPGMPHHPLVFPGGGRGRGRGVPFSGAGHALGSTASSSATRHEDDTTTLTTAETNDARRQRILDAMTSRQSHQVATDIKDMTKPPKRAKERIVPTLQSLCCYEVAVLLTAKDSKSSKYLKLLGENVGSQMSEGIIHELIKLKQLDQLSFKRLHRCSIVNMVLDAYPRATDSLMDSIGASQARSLTYLSLKECIILTDKGFSNIGRFEELEYLDLSHCRITDKTLEFTSSLANLNMLHLSATKVTSDLQHLHNIGFPNREHDLLSVLPAAAALPLTHLDLTGFLFITDDAILTLAAATNLQVLSLAGTKLTNVGSAVFVHMLSLKELSLDRTSIGDKGIEYLRVYVSADLGRIEVLSLQRCERVTTAGIMLLGRCAFFAIKLKRLNLGYNKYIHDEALAVFTQCKELTTLNLEYTDVSEEKALLLQYSLPSLTQLRVQGVTNGAVYEEHPRPTFT